MTAAAGTASSMVARSPPGYTPGDDMSGTLVMKFGGASLADGDAVHRVCRIVAERLEPPPLIVVSAHRGVTSLLERCAREAALGRVEIDRVRQRHRGLLRQLALDPELLDRHVAELRSLLAWIAGRRSLSAGELDLALSFGERMSARIVAAALRRQGHLATPVDAFDLGLTTDSRFGRATPLPGFRDRLRTSLAEVPGIPVVTGFLAKDESGNLTTLGRNGSDLTATLMAHAIGASRLEFWKDVPGIMTADPRLVPDARAIDVVTPEAAAELAFHGASVLHPSALDDALTGGLAIFVRSVLAPDLPGTELRRDAPEPGPVAIAGHAELNGLAVAREGERGPAELFALLQAKRVTPRVLHGESGRVQVWAPPGSGFEEVARDLEDRATPLPPVASVVVIGGPGLATDALEILERAGLPPRLAVQGRSSRSCVFLVELEKRAEATRVLHVELFAEARARASGPVPE